MAASARLDAPGAAGALLRAAGERVLGVLGAHQSETASAESSYPHAMFSPHLRLEWPSGQPATHVAASWASCASHWRGGAQCHARTSLCACGWGCGGWRGRGGGGGVEVERGGGEGRAVASEVVCVVRVEGAEGVWGWLARRAWSMRSTKP